MEPRYWDIIGKQLQGSLTADEAAELQEWLQADPENQRRYAEILKAWELSGELDYDFAQDEDAEWAKLNRALDDAQTGAAPEIPARRSISKAWIVRIAAVLIVAFGLILFFLSRGGGDPEMTTLASGERSLKVVLSDGSTVWLNKQSELQYPKQFASDARPVRLKGEAYFEVAADAARPFSVRFGGSMVTVLGTAFNIRVEREGIEEVALVEGKVRYTTARDGEFEMAAGDYIRIQPGIGLLQTKTAFDRNAISWRADKLEFDHAIVEDVVYALERHFDVDILVRNDSLLACPWSATYPKPELSAILQELEAGLDLTSTQLNDSTIMLDGGSCEPD